MKSVNNVVRLSKLTGRFSGIFKMLSDDQTKVINNVFNNVLSKVNHTISRNLLVLIRDKGRDEIDDSLC